MNRYKIQPGVGYWIILDRHTGEAVADIVDRRQARKVCGLLNGTRTVDELERPLPGEQLRMWSDTGPGQPRPT